jgi:hypothetical protein
VCISVSLFLLLSGERVIRRSLSPSPTSTVSLIASSPENLRPSAAGANDSQRSVGAHSRGRRRRAATSASGPRRTRESDPSPIAMSLGSAALAGTRVPRSSLRDPTLSLLKTLLKCHSTVRGLMKSCVPISGFV